MAAMKLCSRARTKIRRGAGYRFDSAAYSRALSILQQLEGLLKGYSVTINVVRNQIQIGHIGRIDYYQRFGLENGFIGIVVAWSEQPAKPHFGSPAACADSDQVHRERRKPAFPHRLATCPPKPG